MNKNLKFGLLAAIILGTIGWLAAGGVNPDKDVAPQYAMHVLSLHDGRILRGVIVRQDPAGLLVLGDNRGERFEIPLDQIEEPPLELVLGAAALALGDMGLDLEVRILRDLPVQVIPDPLQHLLAVDLGHHAAPVPAASTPAPDPEPESQQAPAQQQGQAVAPSGESPRPGNRAARISIESVWF